jgi:hypothetical protein
VFFYHTADDRQPTTSEGDTSSFKEASTPDDGDDEPTAVLSRIDKPSRSDEQASLADARAHAVQVINFAAEPATGTRRDYRLWSHAVVQAKLELDRSSIPIVYDTGCSMALIDRTVIANEIADPFLSFTQFQSSLKSSRRTRLLTSFVLSVVE